MAAAGLDVEAMKAADARAVADLKKGGALLGQATAAATGIEATAATVYGAWVNFHLYNGTNCANTVKAAGYCGWLYHKYTASSTGATYTSSYPARSGNNNPANDWMPNVGPIPNEYSWKWGFMNGVYRGYEVDTSASFYPGKWRLDPWSVTRNGVTRGAFEIHGGSGAHDFWSSGTLGCIRLPQTSVTGLKSKWDTRTDNKASGAYVYIYY
jgi:hypothetical protein